MEIRAFAERLLRSTSIEDKLARPGSLTDDRPGPALAPPTRPARAPGQEIAPPGLRAEFPKLGPDTCPRERAYALHSFANHELLAMEAMAAALLRFPDAPAALRRQLAVALTEEQTHFRLYQARMEALGVEFGERPLSGFFWRALSSADSPRAFLSRLSLTFEQANLDFAAFYRQRFLALGDAQTAAVFERVLRDEIGHVAIGVRWFERWLARPLGWEDYRAALPASLSASRAKGPIFLVEERRQAGLSEDFIDQLRLHSSARSRPPVVWCFNAGAELALRRQPQRLGGRALALRADLELCFGLLAAPDDVLLVQRLPSDPQRARLQRLGLPCPELVQLPADPDATPTRPQTPRAAPEPRGAAQTAPLPPASEPRAAAQAEPPAPAPPADPEAPAGPASEPRAAAQAEPPAPTPEPRAAALTPAPPAPASSAQTAAAAPAGRTPKPEARPAALRGRLLGALRPWAETPGTAALRRDFGLPEGLPPRPDLADKRFGCRLMQTYATTHPELAAALGPLTLLGEVVHRPEDLPRAHARIAELGAEQLVVKHPLDSSGRSQQRARCDQPLPDGLRRWAARQLAAQEALIVEPWLPRVRDLSLLLSIHPDRRRPREALLELLNRPQGAYLGHRLGPALAGLSPGLRRRLAGLHPEGFMAWVDAFGQVVREALLAEGYTGPAGVDMMLFRWQGQVYLRPLVELNPRWTMGFIAHKLGPKIAPKRTALFLQLRLPPGEPAPQLLDRLGDALPLRWSPRGKLDTGLLPLTDPEQARFALPVLAVAPQPDALRPLLGGAEGT